MSDITTGGLSQHTWETADLLRQLIRNECVNDGTPDSDHEFRSALLLHDCLSQLAIEVQTYELYSDRMLLVARLEGRPVEPSQYTSIRYAERLDEVGAAPSIGTVGDALDNAMAESTIGLHKTELINRERPWRNHDHVEIGTCEYVWWFNNIRLHTEIGDVPPAELEETYYRQQQDATEAAQSKQNSLRQTRRDSERQMLDFAWPAVFGKNRRARTDSRIPSRKAQ